MSTRTEDFKAEQLTHHDSKRAQKGRAKAKARTAHVAKAKLDRASNATHNEAKRAESRSAYALDPGSRKSTRGSANRAKPDSSLRKTATARTSSPEARATRKKEGGGKRKGR